MSDEEQWAIDEQWGMAIHDALDALESAEGTRSIGHGRLGPVDDLGPGWIDMDTQELGRALRLAGWLSPSQAAEQARGRYGPDYDADTQQ